MHKLTITLMLASVSLSSLIAQKDKSKEFTWGKIPVEDLKMTVYAPDSGAAAVVLFNNCTMEINEMGQELKMAKKVHRRVKLLKKSAFDSEGNISISYYSGDNTQGVSGLRAAIYHPDGTKQEFGRRDFVEEKRTKEISVKKFAFPNMREGSVIEYEYEKISDNFTNLEPWYFQEDVPVVQSNLYLSIPEWFEFVYLFQGSIRLKTDEKTTQEQYILGRRPNILSAHYQADSVIGLKPEGYITTMEDYLAKVSFQLKRIIYPDGSVRENLSTWAKTANDLTDNQYVGQQCFRKAKYGDVWKAVKPVIEGVQSDSEKIVRIYDYLAHNMNWNEEFSMWADTDLDDAFKKKTANSGELNMMLVACLNEAGIKAFPMLVSTRDHGKPITTYPILRQFNHLICYVEKNGKPWLLDVGSVTRPAGLVRIPSLNREGWILDKSNPRWVSIVPQTSSETMLASFTLTDDGTLKGNFQTTHRSYSAMRTRDEALEDTTHQELKKKLAKSFPDIVIDSVSYVNVKDLSQPCKRAITCSIPNAAQVAGDLIYVKPTLNTDYDENPFKLAKREYPVDIPYPIKDQFVLNLTIPEDYKVEELPKNVNFVLAENGGRFSYNSSIKGNVIQLVVRIEMNRIHFEPEEYPDVKTLFDYIASKSAEQIVLKKKT